MNHTELWDTKLAWYSPTATRCISLYGSVHDHGIGSFGPP